MFTVFNSQVMGASIETSTVILSLTGSWFNVMTVSFVVIREPVMLKLSSKANYFPKLCTFSLDCSIVKKPSSGISIDLSLILASTARRKQAASFMSLCPKTEAENRPQTGLLLKEALSSLVTWRIYL